MRQDWKLPSLTGNLPKCFSPNFAPLHLGVLMAAQFLAYKLSPYAYCPQDDKVKSWPNVSEPAVIFDYDPVNIASEVNHLFSNTDLFEIDKFNFSTGAYAGSTNERNETSTTGFDFVNLYPRTYFERWVSLRACLQKVEISREGSP